MSGLNTTMVPEALDSPYNYIPTESVAIIFVVLFGVSTVAHIVGAFWFRLWWLLPTAALACAGEVLGWTGRLWSSINVLNDDAFMMQICATIISPTPLIAAVFIIFAALVQRLGPCYSRLSARWYTRIFLSCDIIALVVQGAGGGIASSANTQSGTDLGSHIMLGGIIFQLVALVFFMVLATETIVRGIYDRPVRMSATNDSVATLYRAPRWTGRLKLMTAGVAFMAIVLFIRSIYRTIELSDGWNGRIISTQVYFNVLDGAMVVLATYTLNILHPGYLLYNVSAEEEMELKNSDETMESLPARQYA